jgi:hypothetical protein
MRREETMDTNQSQKNEVPKKLILPREQGDPKAQVRVDGELYARDEVEDVLRQKRAQRAERIASYPETNARNMAGNRAGQVVPGVLPGFSSIQEISG